MTHTIRIPKPRDPLAGMIDQHRGRFARKWRVPVSEVEDPAERAPAASSSDPDGFVAKIRELLGVREQ